jgi:hypothetical protein
MTQRYLVETSTELKTPAPVEALDYAAARDDGPWRIFVNALALAAGVLGLERGLRFGGYAGMTLADGGFHHLNLGNTISIIGLTIQGLAALTMLVAAIACLNRCRWGRSLMIDAAIVMVCASVVAVVGVVIGTLSLPPMRGPNSRLRWSSLLLATLPRTIEGFILPALLVWLMTRAPVRKQFESWSSR